jgi:hypothetical protein
MDFTKTIQGLRQEKEQLDRVIASLEGLQGGMTGAAPEKGRRGRKFLSAEERREVSARMKKYWAGQLNQRQGRA